MTLLATSTEKPLPGSNRSVTNNGNLPEIFFFFFFGCSSHFPPLSSCARVKPQPILTTIFLDIIGVDFDE